MADSILIEIGQTLEMLGCCHGHSIKSTPAMMYPEMIACAVRHAADKAIANALELYQPDADMWAENIAAAVWDEPAIETREEFKAAVANHFFALQEGARRAALAPKERRCIATVVNVNRDFGQIEREACGNNLPCPSHEPTEGKR